MATSAPQPISSKPSKIERIPPPEEFWQKYSPHYEFPISSLTSIAFHVLAFTAIILVALRMWEKVDNKTAPPVRGMMVIDDDSGTGEGQAGSGGGYKDEAKDETSRPQEVSQPLPEIDLKREMIAVSSWAPELKDTPDLLAAVANSPNRERLDKLGDDMKRRLMGLGEKKGAGTGEGNSRTDQPGKGTGGTGEAASSRRRAGRWILLFRTESGADYLAQLAAMKAKLVFPLANGRKLFLDDLTNPGKRQELGENPLPELYFIDDNLKSIRPIAEELGLREVPQQLIAFFPKEVEEELAAKERGYRNRPENVIYSTTFRILVRDGRFTVTVVDQQLNRK